LGAFFEGLTKGLGFLYVLRKPQVIVFFQFIMFLFVFRLQHFLINFSMQRIIYNPHPFSDIHIGDSPEIFNIMRRDQRRLNSDKLQRQLFDDHPFAVDCLIERILTILPIFFQVRYPRCIGFQFRHDIICQQPTMLLEQRPA
jgi:hypothetical protein